MLVPRAVLPAAAALVLAFPGRAAADLPAPPPPTYAPPPVYYGPPPVYYAPQPSYYPPAYAVPPLRFQPSPRRSVTMMVFGIVMSGVGGAMLVTGAALSIDICFDGCPGRDHTGAKVLAVAGALHVLAGVPLAIVGSLRVAPTKQQASWIGEPGGPGWRWRF